MIRTLFQSMQDLGKGARRPANEAPADVKKLGVLGAGVMGAGIAYVSALAGIDVTLVDTTRKTPTRARTTRPKLLDKEIARGRSTPDKKAEALGAHHADGGFRRAQGRRSRHRSGVRRPRGEGRGHQEGRRGDDDDARSSAPTRRRCRSPASPKPAPGRRTSSAFISSRPSNAWCWSRSSSARKPATSALATALDYVRKIKKTPIVVNDARGFYTSRCFGTYVDEGLHMLTERITPALIENAGRMAGMPMGPMEVLDSVGIDTALKITRADPQRGGKCRRRPTTPKSSWPGSSKTWAGRASRRARASTITAPTARQPACWPELYSYGGSQWQSFDDRPRSASWKCASHRAGARSGPRLRGRRRHRPARCRCRRDPGLGLRALYRRAAVVHRHGGRRRLSCAVANAMAKAYGDRFAPNKLLKDMAAKKDTFYRRFAPKAAA